MHETFNFGKKEHYLPRSQSICAGYMRQYRIRFRINAKYLKDTDGWPLYKVHGDNEMYTVQTFFVEGPDDMSYLDNPDRAKSLYEYLARIAPEDLNISSMDIASLKMSKDTVFVDILELLTLYNYRGTRPIYPVEL